MHFQCKICCLAENTKAAIRSTLNSCAQTPLGSFEPWYFTILQFTIRELSNPYDKLPAVAGLAETLVRDTGDMYLAGLFRSDLPRGLLWGSYPIERTLVRTVYRAPSWSWAANDGSVMWDLGLQVISQCNIIDTQISSAYYLGRPIIWGFLKLSGRIEPIQARQQNHLQNQCFPLALL